jgi:hypothetical protein
MEIEIPRRWLRAGWWLLLIGGPLLVGLRASPANTAGRPMLLTPRLAHVHEYRREAAGWVRVLQQADQSLEAILADPHGELFAQNERAGRLVRELQVTIEAIDRTSAPPAFEALHEWLAATANACLKAALAAARWIGEPGDERLEAARAARQSARAELERLIDNPWIAVRP